MADDSQIKQELESNIREQVVAIRNRRRQVEENWLKSHKAWISSGYQRRFRASDTSVANYNIPFARRAIERSIVRCIEIVTPSVRWYGISPVGEGISDVRLSNVDSFMSYVLKKKIPTRANIGQLIRSIIIYGRCHLKTSVTVKNGSVWPTQRVVDPFNFYIFPETNTTFDNDFICFEDFMVSYQEYTNKVKLGLVDEITKGELNKPDWPYHIIERLAQQGITDPTQGVSDFLKDSTRKKLDEAGSAYVSMTEIWIPKGDRLYQCYIVSNLKKGPRIVRFKPSDYDEPLYKTAIHRALPGESYTNSMSDDIVELQGLTNDTLNEYIDGVNFEQGMIGIDSTKVTRKDSLKAKGRAIWEFQGDPKESITMFQPNVSSTNQLRAAQIFMGLINSLAGTGTIAEGQPGRNMPRAGGAVNNLVNLSLSDIKDVAKTVEQCCLTPGLSDIYKVSSQFIPDTQLLRIPGGKGISDAILRKEDILGDFEFEWIGSLQSQDEQAAAQKMMIFLNMAPQINPMLQQQGYSFNFVELVKTIWRNYLGERGLGEIVVPLNDLQKIMMQKSMMESNERSKGTGSSNNSQLSYSLPNVAQGFVQQGS